MSAFADQCIIMGEALFVNILFEKSLDFPGIIPAFPGFCQLWCYENNGMYKVAKWQN